MSDPKVSQVSADVSDTNEAAMEKEAQAILDGLDNEDIQPKSPEQMDLPNSDGNSTVEDSSSAPVVIKKRGRPKKAAGGTPAVKKSKVVKDVSVQEPKKRGRPKKAEVVVKAKKVIVQKSETTVEAPKRRGRPKKVEAIVETAKKRGRPKKEVVIEVPKKRGRPAKVVEASVVEAPKKRGRPAKVVVAPVEAPKKRGRPAKAPVVPEVAVKVPVVAVKKGKPRSATIPPTTLASLVRQARKSLKQGMKTLELRKELNAIDDRVTPNLAISIIKQAQGKAI